MESADLNSPAHDDARLDALLRSAATPLDDDGFTSRVIAALPPPQPASAPWLRTVLCLAAGAAGCGIVLARGLSWPGLQSSADHFLAAVSTDAAARVFDPWFVSAVTVAAVSLLFAFRAELRERFF